MCLFKGLDAQYYPQGFQHSISVIATNEWTVKTGCESGHTRGKHDMLQGRVWAGLEMVPELRFNLSK